MKNSSIFKLLVSDSTLICWRSDSQPLHTGCAVNLLPINSILGILALALVAAALVSAAKQPQFVEAIVSRGGRPDLAGSWLIKVPAPTLLIVGGNDKIVIELNYQAAAELRAEHRLEIVPNAGHLFEEPGALE